MNKRKNNDNLQAGLTRYKQAEVNREITGKCFRVYRKVYGRTFRWFSWRVYRPYERRRLWKIKQTEISTPGVVGTLIC